MYPSLQQFPSYSNRNYKKIAVFTYRSPHFCFPWTAWRRPCNYHAVGCMDGKTIQCLPNPSQHVPINSFRVIRCLSQWVSPKIAICTYRSPHFFPWRRPCNYHAICLHGWKDNSMLAKPHAACTHLLSTVSQLFEPQVQNIAVSRTAAHLFVSPGDAPAMITQYVAWMKMLAKPLAAYLSIFNSFQVIRCLNQCISTKIAIFFQFLFPLGTPLGQSR